MHEVVRTNPIDEPIWASLAVATGPIYIRGESTYLRSGSSFQLPASSFRPSATSFQFQGGSLEAGSWQLNKTHKLA